MGVNPGEKRGEGKEHQYAYLAKQYRTYLQDLREAYLIFNNIKVDTDSHDSFSKEVAIVIQKVVNSSDSNNQMFAASETERLLLNVNRGGRYILEG
jgi:hypothetical protein